MQIHFRVSDIKFLGRGAKEAKEDQNGRLMLMMIMMLREYIIGKK